MPDPADYLADLTTAPIFDDAVFSSEVLGLQNGQNEEHLEFELVAAARDVGIEDPYRFLYTTANVSTAESTTSVSSIHRSSMSIHSRETQSTSLSSPLSRTSKDISTLDSVAVAALRISPRISLSSDDNYDNMMRRFRYNVRRTSSNVSDVPSILSSSSSPSKSMFRKQKRASGLFAIFRKDSSVRLPSPQARSSPVAIAVGTKSPDTASLQDSAYGEVSSSIELQRLSAQFKNLDSAKKRAPESLTEDTELMDQLLEDESFKGLKTQQKEQFQRVSVFESNQRKALSAYHHWSLNGLLARLESERDKMTKQHAVDLERLDESQIIAEHDLRKAHAQETQNVATALKYMEAYCSGSNPNTQAVHIVTQEDRNKLARQHITQQKLPAKHESAINVLRARQEKDTKVKLQKQEEELRLLQADYERKKQAEELQYAKDVNRLEALVEARRKRIMHQWDLRFETWKRTWEKEHGAPLIGRISHEAWSEASPVDALLDPSSSLALYLQIMA